MKVLKPLRLSLLQRVVEHERRYSLVISVLAYVDAAAPDRLLAEPALWKEAVEAIAGGVIDEGTPKSRAEVLVSGGAFAPGGQPARAVMLRLSVSRGDKQLIDKRLAVLGDRYWKGAEPSEPAPFTSIPVDFAHAFGGEGYALNPLGKGFVDVETEHGPVRPLPNVENPSDLVATKGDRKPPAGFGPLDIQLPQRLRRMGKRYDDKWLKTRFPGPAEDFDALFYNVAPEDQWLAGFFEGNETLAVEGMHPEKKRVELSLAPLVVRAFATQRAGDQERFVALDTRLDTVHLLPHLERAVLVYRGVLEVAEDDAADVLNLMVAAERPDAPRSLEHYQRVLAKRLDKDEGAFASLQDADLLPEMSGGPVKLDTGDIGEMTKLEMRQLDNMERGRKKKMAEGRKKLEAAGLAVADDYEDAQLPARPDPDDIDAVITYVETLKAMNAEAQKDLEQRRDAMHEQAREAFAEVGKDFDADGAQAVTGGPPVFSADEHLMMLHDMARISAAAGQPIDELERNLTDPQYEQALIELEQRIRETYTLFAHVMPAATVDRDKAELLRVRVSAAKEADEALTGVNLIGADLHDLDLSGMDLSRCLLEQANLSGADLSGANLCGAVLARADLTDTRLCDANLTGANLGGTKLVRTDLSGALLDEAVFMRSELEDVVLIGARFRDTNFFETRFANTELSHAELRAPLFLQCDLRATAFTGAAATWARFLEADVRGVDFTGSDLDKAQFLKCQGDGACFAGAKLTGAVFVYETSFASCNFADADLSGANLRGTPLSGGDFRGARLHAADLSSCDLRGANLHRIQAREARLVRADLSGADLRGADLLGAIMQKARLFGTDLRGANLSRGDISLVEVDGATQAQDALMLDTRVDPQRPNGKQTTGKHPWGNKRGLAG